MSLIGGGQRRATVGSWVYDDAAPAAVRTSTRPPLPDEHGDTRTHPFGTFAFSVSTRRCVKARLVAQALIFFRGNLPRL